MNRLRVRFALRGLAPALLLLAAACAGVGSGGDVAVTTRTEAGTTTAPPAGAVAARSNALVRFVHAVPGVSSVDLFAGDSKAFDGAFYKSVTAYAELPSASGLYRLRLAGQETGEPLVEEQKSFGAGRHHTVVFVGPASATGLFSKGGGGELRFLADDLVAPAAGRAKVRVFNASPDLDEVDLYASGRAEPLVKGAGFGAATAYAEAEPAAAGLEVRRAGENITTLNVPGQSVEAGGLYTVFIVGGTKGAARLEAFVVEDRLGAAPAR